MTGAITLTVYSCPMPNCDWRNLDPRRSCPLHPMASPVARDYVPAEDAAESEEE